MNRCVFSLDLIVSGLLVFLTVIGSEFQICGPTDDIELVCIMEVLNSLVGSTELFLDLRFSS